MSFIWESGDICWPEAKAEEPINDTALVPGVVNAFTLLGVVWPSR